MEESHTSNKSPGESNETECGKDADDLRDDRIPNGYRISGNRMAFHQDCESFFGAISSGPDNHEVGWIEKWISVSLQIGLLFIVFVSLAFVPIVLVMYHLMKAGKAISTWISNIFRRIFR